jgi:hypothetical protein
MDNRAGVDFEATPDLNGLHTHIAVSYACSQFKPFEM